VEWAQTCGGGQRVQIGLVGMMSIQKSDHASDSFVIIHTDNLNWSRFEPTRFLLQFYRDFCRSRVWFS
jgi:hypothetical protein